MPQLFRPRANGIARAVLVVLASSPVLLIGAAYAIDSSAFITREQIAREQPVPFSHKHHVQGLGLDCRYCHSGVEESAAAGLPSTATCMTCHRQIWSDSAMLEPVRRSYRDSVPLQWNRVHDLPDFAYFDHSIHIARGVGCSSCHGRVDQMPLVWAEHPMQMGWCLDCHRNPGPHLRPQDQVFNMAWEPGPDQAERATQLQRELHIKPPADCYACHR